MIKAMFQYVSMAQARGHHRLSALPVRSGCPSLTQAVAAIVRTLQHLFRQNHAKLHKPACTSGID